MRNDDDIPIPPPLPASHPTQKARTLESAKIVGKFYLEFLGSSLLLLVLAYTVQRFIPVPDAVVLGGMFLFSIVCVRRLATNVIESRKRRGTPRWSATISFLSALVLPLFVMGTLLYSPAKIRGPQALQTEAKVSLNQIYKAERFFYKDYGKYSLNTKEIARTEVLIPRYILGFATACSVKDGVALEKAQWIAEDPTFIQARKPEIDAYFRNVRRAEDCQDPKEGYEAYAVGVISENAPLDVWRIDNKRVLVNLQRGY